MERLIRMSFFLTLRMVQVRFLRVAFLTLAKRCNGEYI